MALTNSLEGAVTATVALPAFAAPWGEAGPGMVPSVVNQMVVPGSPVRVTVWLPKQLPGGGLKAGLASVMR